MGAAVPDSQSLSYEIDSEGFKVVADRVIDCTGEADVAHHAGAPTRKAPVEEMQAAWVMFHLSGVDKQAFLAGIRADPATYGDWSAGERAVDTSGKEDEMFSPFLRKPFAQAIRDGVIPAGLTTIAGTWGVACCAVTGQAAGIAAALSVRTGRPVHELDARLIQAELDRQGVRHQ